MGSRRGGHAPGHVIARKEPVRVKAEHTTLVEVAPDGGVVEDLAGPRNITAIARKETVFRKEGHTPGRVVTRKDHTRIKNDDIGTTRKEALNRWSDFHNSFFPTTLCGVVRLLLLSRAPPPPPSPPRLPLLCKAPLLYTASCLPATTF